MPLHLVRHALRLLAIAVLAWTVLTASSATPASSAPSPASWADGRWAMGEVDEDDFDYVLEIHGGTASVSSLHGKSVLPSGSIRVDASAAPVIRLAFPQVHGTRPGPEARLLVQTRNQGLLWMDQENSLFRVRRLGNLPEVLRGTWHVVRRSPESPRTVEITDDGVVFTPEKGPARRLRACPLVQTGPSIALLVEDPDEKEYVLNHFQPLPDGSILVWKAEHSTYLILHRPGQVPSWVPAPRH